MVHLGENEHFSGLRQLGAGDIEFKRQATAKLEGCTKLYDPHQDFSLADDLAVANPAKLKKLQATA